MITQKRLKELFHYDPETGVFTRLVTISHNAKAGDIAGCLRKDGYLVIAVDKKLYLSHRLAWLYMTGEFPEYQVDHDDGVRDNNRWDNLKEATDSSNRKNMGVGVRNKSGVVGVRFNEECGKWQANIFVDYRNVYLGLFNSLDDAAKARRDAEKRFGYHEKHGRRAAHQGGSS